MQEPGARMMRIRIQDSGFQKRRNSEIGSLGELRWDRSFWLLAPESSLLALAQCPPSFNSTKRMSGIRSRRCATGLARSPTTHAGCRTRSLAGRQSRQTLSGRQLFDLDQHPRHNHPVLNQAIWEQLKQVAHTSFLGFTNPKAVELAVGLVRLLPGSLLTKVFFSDNGSTAVEVAIKMAAQYFLQTKRPENRVRFF